MSLNNFEQIQERLLIPVLITTSVVLVLDTIGVPMHVGSVLFLIFIFGAIMPAMVLMVMAANYCMRYRKLPPPLSRNATRMVYLYVGLCFVLFLILRA